MSDESRPEESKGPKNPATIPVLKLAPPTKEAMAKAREQAKASAAQGAITPGTVIGLPQGWHPYTLDKANTDGRLNHMRAMLQSKGYVKADGLTVAGVSSPEVWIIPTEVWEEEIQAQREARDNKSRKDWKIKQINQ